MHLNFNRDPSHTFPEIADVLRDERVSLVKYFVRNRSLFIEQIWHEANCLGSARDSDNVLCPLKQLVER